MQQVDSSDSNPDRCHKTGCARAAGAVKRFHKFAVEAAILIGGDDGGVFYAGIPEDELLQTVIHSESAWAGSGGHKEGGPGGVESIGAYQLYHIARSYGTGQALLAISELSALQKSCFVREREDFGGLAIGPEARSQPISGIAHIRDIQRPVSSEPAGARRRFYCSGLLLLAWMIVLQALEERFQPGKHAGIGGMLIYFQLQAGLLAHYVLEESRNERVGTATEIRQINAKKPRVSPYDFGGP
jgi:hypothetical protein